MKYFFLFLWFVSFDSVVSAQKLSVFSVIGTVERIDEQGVWRPLARRECLSFEDRVRIGDRSALNLIDDEADRVYSLGESGEFRLGDLIHRASRSAVRKFFSYFRRALLRGDTDRMVAADATVVYRDPGVDAAVAAALASSTSDNRLSLALVDVCNGTEFAETAAVDCDFFFRITNHAVEPLFVNVAAIDASGEVEVCFDADLGFTMSHLLVPACSTIDFSDSPFTFCYPRGEQRFVVVACDAPFDLRHALSLLSDGGSYASSGDAIVSTTTRTIIIR